MQILKNRRFARDADAQGLEDSQLEDAIKEMQDGLMGSALGANLYKKRVGIGNKGKRGGLRTIILFRAESK